MWIWRIRLDNVPALNLYFEMQSFFSPFMEASSLVCHFSLQKKRERKKERWEQPNAECETPKHEPIRYPSLIKCYNKSTNSFKTYGCKSLHKQTISGNKCIIIKVLSGRTHWMQVCHLPLLHQPLFFFFKQNTWVCRLRNIGFLFWITWNITLSKLSIVVTPLEFDRLYFFLCLK